MQQLQADVAKAEVQRDCAAAAKMKMPLFPMSPLAAPPIRHDTSPAARLVEEDKENMNKAAAAPRGKGHAQVILPDPSKASSKTFIMISHVNCLMSRTGMNTMHLQHDA